MIHSRTDVRIMAHLHMWTARIDGRWLNKPWFSRIRKDGKLRRVKPPWKTMSAKSQEQE